VPMHGGVPVIATVERWSQLAGRPYIGVREQCVSNFIGIFAMNAVQG